jgi:tetratricopeptide (TPR) repeat protein
VGVPGLRLCALLVVVVAALPYARTLPVPFAFDDVPHVTANPAVHALDLSPGSLGPSLAGFPLHRWLVRLSFAVNHALGGLDPAGYHLFNLLAHVIAALLVLALAVEVLLRIEPGLEPDRRRAVALVAALLFAVHPIQTMAVTYVVQRMTVLSALFSLAALICWCRARRSSGARAAAWYGGAVTTAFLGMSSKENAAVLALLVPALEWWARTEDAPGAQDRPGTVERWAIPAGWTLAAAAAIAAALFTTYASEFRDSQVFFRISIVERLMSQPRILCQYLARMAVPWPGWLHLEYDIEPSRGPFDPPTTILALLVLGAVCAAIVALRRRLPAVSFGGAFFVLALTVEQSFLPLDLAFEHRLYLPMFGIAVAAAWALEHAAGRLAVARWALALPFVLLLAAATVARNEQWRDPVRLNEQDAAAFPRLTGPLLNLGVEYRGRGDYDRAEAIYRRLLEIDPRDARAWSNLAYVALSRGEPRSAVERAQRAIDLDPSLGPPRYLRAVGLLAAGLPEEALGAYRMNIQLNPRDVASRTDLGVLLLRRGELDGAIAELQTAVQLDPGYHRAWASLSAAQLRAGRGAEALSSARQAVALAPRAPSSIDALRRAMAP